VGDTNRPEDKDVISELADAGEDALRRLVDIPRRVLAGARDTADERFQDIATRLRAIDPLERRVTALEKRLDSLEARPMPCPWYAVALCLMGRMWWWDWVLCLTMGLTLGS
jgi:hypothetical protein